MSAENDLLVIALVVLALLIALGWYLSYSAARLDRLHAKVEGAMSVLDAQLVRRAEASLELATSGALDPASSLILADAAETRICVMLSASTLLGVGLFQLTGAAWLDPVAAFVIAAFAIHEGREAWEGELVEGDDDDDNGGDADD